MRSLVARHLTKIAESFVLEDGDIIGIGGIPFTFRGRGVVQTGTSGSLIRKPGDKLTYEVATSAIRKKAQEKESVTVTLTAPPDTLRKVLGFLKALEYNGNIGHSANFALSFDGDGHEFLHVKGLDKKLEKEVDGYGELNADQKHGVDYYKTKQ